LATEQEEEEEEEEKGVKALSVALAKS